MYVLAAGNGLRFLPPPPPRPLAIRRLERPLVSFHGEREGEREREGREGAFHVPSAIEELAPPSLPPSPLVVFAKRRIDGERPTAAAAVVCKLSLKVA